MKDHFSSQDVQTQPVTATSFNPDDYRDELSDFGLSSSQEDELLQTLWHIMSTMVDIGWGVDNVQQVLPELFNQESGLDTLDQAATTDKGYTL